MNKSTTISLLLLFGVSCSKEINAQIQLSADDVYNKGTFQMARDTSHGMTPGTPGPNKVWDFSGLKSHDTYNFRIVAYNGMGNGNVANLAKVDGNDTFDYIQKTGTEIFIVTPLQDFDRVFYEKYRAFSLPFKYNSVNSDSVTSVLCHPGMFFGMPAYDSVRISFKMLFYSKADAYGLLKLPTSDFDALRIKTESIILVRLSGKKGSQPYEAIPDFDQDEKTVTYAWYAKDKGHCIASYDSAFDEMEYMASGILSTANPYKQSELIISNPFDHEITVRNNGREDYMVSFFDLSGKLVFSQAINSESDEVINTLAWPAGVYYVEMMNLATQAVVFEKLLK